MCCACPQRVFLKHRIRRACVRAQQQRVSCFDQWKSWHCMIWTWCVWGRTLMSMLYGPKNTSTSRSRFSVCAQSAVFIRLIIEISLNTASFSYQCISQHCLTSYFCVWSLCFQGKVMGLSIDFYLEHGPCGTKGRSCN